MDEPLLNCTESNEKKNTNLLGFVKKIIDDVNEDLNAIDYTINTLLFGHHFDLLFIEHDHSQTLEWLKFRSVCTKPLPSVIQDAMLKNDLGIAAHYSQAKTKGISEEAFWLKWQFYTFLKDQHLQKQQQLKQKSESQSNANLLKTNHAVLAEELEEWD